jgi:methylated-DNA-[protein]-cysteine S-methyltransferase
MPDAAPNAKSSVMTTRHATIESPLGELTLVAAGPALVGLYFPHHWYKPDESTFGREVDAASDPVLGLAAQQLGEYFDGERTQFELVTATQGNAFQERVWALLGDVAYGETTTYGDLAAQLGDRSLAQEVGAAIGRNPLCVIVPCHRVVATSGKLTGYAGGLKRKAALLELEEPAHAKAQRPF